MLFRLSIWVLWEVSLNGFGTKIFRIIQNFWLNTKTWIWMKKLYMRVWIYTSALSDSKSISTILNCFNEDKIRCWLLFHIVLIIISKLSFISKICTFNIKQILRLVLPIFEFIWFQLIEFTISWWDFSKIRIVINLLIKIEFNCI